jgi:MFS family permease
MAYLVDKKKLWSVITASSVGTLIEWYDFYLFGSLAAILATQFFPTTNPTIGFLSTLATFAAGFIVRPFGALVFGRLGDLIGRKYTFLVTLVLMGGSTFAIGLIPNYETIGILAPILVLLLRLVQGLALGGEYGGAATYVAEHAPDGRRGFYTSFIQTTATLGLFVSIAVILGVREVIGVDAFTTWGWRIPFLLSALLVGVSVYIRLRMQESPLFAKLKAEGKISKNPLKESFTKKENLQMVLLALFGATAGQGVVWYTGQFYAMSFIQKTCSIEFVQSYSIIATALLMGTPLFVVFGSWSDSFGRKYIMLGGMLLAVLTYRPIYSAMYALSSLPPTTEVESKVLAAPVISVEPEGDTIQQIIRQRTFANGYVVKEKSKIKNDTVLATTREITLSQDAFWWMVGLVLIQVVYVTMVYGPIAAFLVELFPTRIRYTSMSLPYHVGNGIFGGLVPLVATWLFEASKSEANPSGDPLVGLWYPIGIAAFTFVIGLFFLNNKPKGEVLE